MALLTSTTKQRKQKPLPAETQSDSEKSEDLDSGSEDAGSANEDEGNGNAGWANSILKVLNAKPKAEDKIVLARAKRSQAVDPKSKSVKKPKKDYDFEIAGAEVEQTEEDEEEVHETSALDAELTKQQRKNVPLQLRAKPSYRDMERERSLRKVATRGVVQFFNAVRIQQKDLKQQLIEAGPLDSRQDAVLNNINKRKFLDVLMSGKRSKSSAIDNQSDDDDEEDDDEDATATASGKKKSEWNVLRDDFMTNKKIKHWDEENEEEDSEDQAQEEASEDSD